MSRIRGLYKGYSLFNIDSIIDINSVPVMWHIVMTGDRYIEPCQTWTVYDSESEYNKDYNSWNDRGQNNVPLIKIFKSYK